MKETDHFKEAQSLDEIILKLQALGHDIKALKIGSHKWTSFNWSPSDKKRKGGYKAIETPYGIDFLFNYLVDPSQGFKFSWIHGKLSEEDLKKHKQFLKDAESKELAKKMAGWESAKLSAELRWNSAKESISHGYLKKKYISYAYGTRVDSLSKLLIPARDTDGILWSFQAISEDGDKFNHPGGKMEGCFHTIGEINPENELYICEGFDTAVKLNKITQVPCVCCFSSVFMSSVGKSLKAKYPNIKLIFSGDSDAAGKKASLKASREVGGNILIPKFKSPHPDYTDWSDLLEIEGEKTVIHQISEARNAPKSARTQKQDWMLEYLKENEVELLYDYSINMGGEHHKIEILMAEMFLESEKQGVVLSERMIESFLKVQFEKIRLNTWDKISQKLAIYDPSAIEDARAFIGALAGNVTDETLSVFLHFIWQVKRKALGLKVIHHMMPVFEGQSGSGKSNAIDLLLAPLGPLHTQQGLDCLTDERKWPIFEDHLVVNMDEMDRAEKASLAGLKRTITAETLAWKPLFTNLNVNLRNRSTLIGSTNEFTSELIKDPTSIRRFFSITTLPKDQLAKNWPCINALDYDNLWRCVDVEKPSPLMESLVGVQVAQESMKYKSDVELWLEDKGIVPDPEAFASNEAVAESYKAYCNAMNFKYVKPIDAIGRQLSKLGFERKHDGCKRGWKMRLPNTWLKS